MVNRFIFLIIYCHFNLGRDIRGQRACVEDSNVLESCDGRVISKNNLYVDFGVIKYQCSCSFNFAFNAQVFYSLFRNPGFDDCGTTIQIKDINGGRYRMQCTSSVPVTVVSSKFTIVELSCVDSTKCDNAGYCLRIFSNDASIVVNGSCQSKSSSEASIATAQSVPTSLIQSDQTSAMQRNSKQADITAFTLEKGNMLDSCDGQVISNINIYVDFDVIKYQCSCSFTNVFSVEKLYIPCRNLGVDYCKNAIQINEINGKQHRIFCSSSPASLVSTAYIQLQ